MSDSKNNSLLPRWQSSREAGCKCTHIPFQPGFQSGDDAESALVVLVEEELRRDLGRGNASLLFLLHLSEVFDPIAPGILLDHLSDLGVGAAVDALLPVWQT